MCLLVDLSLKYISRLLIVVHFIESSAYLFALSAQSKLRN